MIDRRRVSLRFGAPPFGAMRKVRHTLGKSTPCLFSLTVMIPQTRRSFETMFSIYLSIWVFSESFYSRSRHIFPKCFITIFFHFRSALTHFNVCNEKHVKRGQTHLIDPFSLDAEVLFFSALQSLFKWRSRKEGWLLSTEVAFALLNQPYWVGFRHLTACLRKWTPENSFSVNLPT